MIEADRQGETAVLEIANCLAHERPLLMAGAGLSKLAGYPLWPELMEELRATLNSSVEKNHPLMVSKQYDRYADELLRLAKRPKDLGPLIRRRFGPMDSFHDFDHQVHLRLLALPFCGVVTTNYDRVLEVVCTEYLANCGRAPHSGESPAEVRAYCSPIDLCSDEDRTPVFDLLRRFSCPGLQAYREGVLHLHGYYDNPDRIILRYSDYVMKYGQLLPDTRVEMAGEVPFHHKVIWSLLVTHPFVFVGFGMEDPYFLKMQEIIKTEFRYGTAYVQPRHFAVMPRHEVNPDLEQKLMHSAIRPVPYDLPPGLEGKVERYLCGLSDFLESLDARVTSACGTQPITQGTKPGSEKLGPKPLADEVTARDVTTRMLAKR